MRIAIGSDEAGFQLKESLRKFLNDQEIVKVVIVKDFGVYDLQPVDYPDVAEAVARAIVLGEFDRGILICGTGIGMAIAANKVPGVRAAQVYDSYSAERARKSNDAQIMTLGALVTGDALAKSLVGIWLQSEFQAGRSQLKVNKIQNIESRYQLNSESETLNGCVQ
jgi:ribose 5-phosphate isomerase B